MCFEQMRSLVELSIGQEDGSLSQPPQRSLVLKVAVPVEVSPIDLLKVKVCNVVNSPDSKGKDTAFHMFKVNRDEVQEFVGLSSSWLWTVPRNFRQKGSVQDHFAKKMPTELPTSFPN